MGDRMGRITICDRCGRECRRQYLDTQELDGGFTRIDKYEPPRGGLGDLYRYRRTLSSMRKGIPNDGVCLHERRRGRSDYALCDLR